MHQAESRRPRVFQAGSLVLESQGGLSICQGRSPRPKGGLCGLVGVVAMTLIAVEQEPGLGPQVSGSFPELWPPTWPPCYWLLLLKEEEGHICI